MQLRYGPLLPTLCDTSMRRRNNQTTAGPVFTISRTSAAPPQGETERLKQCLEEGSTQTAYHLTAYYFCCWFEYFLPVEKNETTGSTAKYIEGCSNVEEYGSGSCCRGDNDTCCTREREDLSPNESIELPW
jgi:hypothetical protein